MEKSNFFFDQAFVFCPSRLCRRQDRDLASRQLKEHQSLKHFPSVLTDTIHCSYDSVRRCYSCLIQFSHLRVDNVFVGDNIQDMKRRKRKISCVKFNYGSENWYIDINSWACTGSNHYCFDQKELFLPTEVWIRFSWWKMEQLFETRVCNKVNKLKASILQHYSIKSFKGKLMLLY